MSSRTLLVMAKAPAPGRVKTRLCPPCTPAQASALAQAALEDTLAAVAGSSTRGSRRSSTHPRCSAARPMEATGRSACGSPTPASSRVCRCLPPTRGWCSASACVRSAVRRTSFRRCATWRCRRRHRHQPDSGGARPCPRRDGAAAVGLGRRPVAGALADGPAARRQRRDRRGSGGAPGARRVAGAPGGSVVVELAAHTALLRLRLECPLGAGEWFDWALLDAAGVVEAGADAGLEVVGHWTAGTREYAELAPR